MHSIYFSLAVSLLGLLLYGLTDGASHPKALEAFRIMFWCGLLAFLLRYSGLR